MPSSSKSVRKHQQPISSLAAILCAVTYCVSRCTADDLPVRGFVGETESHVQHIDGQLQNHTTVFIFPHLDFYIAYNGDRVRMRSENTHDVTRCRLSQSTSPLTTASA
jgi:hypothetical protein